MIAGSRIERIVPEPALAISWKKTQATFGVCSSRRVKMPKPIAESAKADAWRGSIGAEFAEEYTGRGGEDKGANSKREEVDAGVKDGRA